MSKLLPRREIRNASASNHYLVKLIIKWINFILINTGINRIIKEAANFYERGLFRGLFTRPDKNKKSVVLPRPSSFRALTKKPQTVLTGFTLIEILTVVFIVGVIASITLANYRGGQRRGDLITIVQRVASVFRRAQSMALTGYPATSGSPGDAYGINIASVDATTYALFIDLNGNYVFNGAPTDELVQTFTLPSDFQIQSSGCVDLSFTKPYGIVYCDGVELAVNQDKIFTLVETKENKYLYIKINSSGKIDVISSL